MIDEIEQLNTESEWTEEVFAPRKLSNANREELTNYLKEKNLGEEKNLGDDSTIGDDSRGLFITDVESWLGMFDEKPNRPFHEIKAQLIAIENKSDQLIRYLDKSYHETNCWMSEGMTAISMCKIFNQLDIEQIKDNIILLRDACKWSIEASKPKRVPRTVTGKEREFISQIAQSYLRRFNEKPSPSRDGKFAQVLEKIAGISDINIHSEKIWKDVFNEIT